RATNAAALMDALQEAFAGVDPRDFFERSAARGLLTGFSQTAAQLLECPQLAARDVFVEMPGTLGGRPWRMPFTTASLTGTPSTYRCSAPALGEHNESLTPEREVAR
ncbi:hypothetical protein C6558_39260, partial [Ensifer sp. NM-2]|uniref:CoA transferase n=1 Tax=Ensifer sp. NM-2 TaxID=2109730 RepID=UPI000D434F8B